MPRAWRALPYTANPRLLAKAPSYADFEQQEHQLKTYGMAMMPKEADLQAALAAAMMDAVENIRELPLGAEFTLYRYSQGLGVRTPSGWTFMVPYDMSAGKPVEKPEKAATKGNPRPRGKTTKAASA